MSSNWLYIDWHSKEVSHIHLSQFDYNEKFEWFRNNGHLIDNRKDAGNRTRKISWYAHPWSYCVEQDHQQVNLYTVDDNFHFTVYYTLCDPSKEGRSQGVSGGDAYNLVNNMFIERNGISLQRAFGRCEQEFIFDKCNMALVPITYINSRDCDFILSNIQKADVSSAYPYCASFDLPDLHKNTIKRMGGIYPPTEEYPFAFYVRSGHMAIYGELDTYKDFRMHPLYSTRGKFDNEIYGDRDMTILMKRSKYNLKDIMEDLYSQKSENKDIKTMMVAFIGYIRSNKSWQHHYMGHISACVYARHIKRMLDWYDIIVKEHNVIEMIATDSICWRGKRMPELTTKEKVMGNFVSEYEDARLLMLANGVYGLEVDKKIVCFKHQGTASEDIKIKIEKLQDIKKFKFNGLLDFDEKSKKFVIIDPVLHSKVEIQRKKVIK